LTSKAHADALNCQCTCFGACPRARAPALARQRTFGALARSRKLKATNTTMYSGTLDLGRVIFCSASLTIGRREGARTSRAEPSSWSAGASDTYRVLLRTSTPSGGGVGGSSGRAPPAPVVSGPQLSWVTPRARWATLRARWATPRARWVTLRARWATLRAPPPL
jgi:hypothetical protein